MSLVPVSRPASPELGRFLDRRADVARELRSLADALVSSPDGPLAAAEQSCATALRSYAEGLETGRFLVGVLGVAKAGKSTLLNALAGDDVSPIDVLVTTGVLHFVGWSEQPQCTVVSLSGR